MRQTCRKWLPQLGSPACFGTIPIEMSKSRAMNVLSLSSGLGWSTPMGVLRTSIMAYGKFHLEGRLKILILFRLHHMVHFVEGPTRWDPVCYGTGSLPHLDVLTSVSRAERNYFCG